MEQVKKTKKHHTQKKKKKKTKTGSKSQIDGRKVHGKKKKKP